MRWPKCWSFSFNISPSNEHTGLIFRMDWLDLLAVQGILKSLLQHHSPKASIFWCSAFFTVQLSHLYMTTGKTIVLTRWTFVGKVMYLLFNMLSRLLITFLPRSKHLLISWLHSPSAVILEPPKIKSDIVSTVSPSISHEVMGPDAMILVFWMLSFKPTFSLSSFTFIKRLFSSSSLSAITVVSSAYLRLLISWHSWFQLVLLRLSSSHILAHPTLVKTPRVTYYYFYYIRRNWGTKGLRQHSKLLTSKWRNQYLKPCHLIPGPRLSMSHYYFIMLYLW